MSQENEFDKLFKERINQMEFEFQDSYWNEMEALLENKKKKRGALFWWLSGFGVASMLCAATLFFIVRNPGEQFDEETKVISRSAHANSNQHNENQEIKNSTNEKNSTKNKNHENQTVRIQAQKQPKTYQTTRLTTNTNQKSNQRTANSRQNKQIRNSEPNHLLPVNQENLFQADENKTNYILEPVHHQTKNIENYALMQDQSASKLDLEESKLADLPTNTPKGRIWNSHVGITVGASFGQSFKTDAGKVGGLGSYWGLRFNYAHKKGLMINTGLSFVVNSIDGLTYEETKKIYGFTQYDVVNTIQYKRMLTANIPFYLGYEGQKFTIAAGVRLNYIMNTKGRVYTWDNSIVDQNIWGYAHGIKHFNMSCGLESTCRLARRWDLGLSVDFDLSSRSEENNSLISPEARLWQTGLFIKYRLN